MKPLDTTISKTLVITASPAHTASAVGNTGVEVVSTPALILFLEDAAEQAIRHCYDPGEASVGTIVNIRHLAAVPAGATIAADARVTAVEGRRVSFDVEVRHGEKVVMTGKHERHVVELARFLAKQGLGGNEP